MAARRHRGNERKGDGGRRRPGPDTLEERIGKVASSCIRPYVYIYLYTHSKSKSKAVPLHAMEALGGERRYSSYSFTTSALDGSDWSASRQGRALPPGERTPVPNVQEAGWAPEPVWTQRLEEKSSASAGDRTPIARSSSP
jgi:hypothetical protein